MGKTLCQFGEVLFDELEQIAVRRGGFASISWLRDGDPGRDSVGVTLGGGAHAKISADAAQYLARVRGAVGSVDELVILAQARLGAASKVTDFAIRVSRAAEKVATLRLRRAWDALVAGSSDAQKRLGTHHDAFVRACEDAGARRGISEGLPLEEEKAAEALRTAWAGLARSDLLGHYKEAVESLCKARRETRDAEVGRGRIDMCKADAQSAEADAAEAKEFAGLAEEAWKVRAESQDAARPSEGSPDVGAEAPDVERPPQGSSELRDAPPSPPGVGLPPDGLRGDALALADAALDAALQAYGSTVRIKSKVDEGRSREVPAAKPGRMTRWFGRILGGRRVRRVPRIPGVLYEMDDIVADASRSEALRMNTVGVAFSGGGIRSATFNLGFLQGLANLGLLKRVDYLSTVSGGGYIGAWFASWVRREGGTAADPTDEVECRGKRERMASAMENVELQLCTSRIAQSRARRRWVTGGEIDTGVEALPPEVCGIRAPGNLPEDSIPIADDICLPLKRVVDGEPQPVYHLRQFSNYLAPKVGLSSADTWTMVSVYLRNLLLNQFILLPLVLAIVLVPRLLLLLFNLDLSRSPRYGVVEWGIAALLLGAGILGFSMTYRVVARIRESRGRVRGGDDRSGRNFEATLGTVALGILGPLTIVAFCFSALFAHRLLPDTFGPPRYLSLLVLDLLGVDETAESLRRANVVLASLGFGLFVGVVRGVTSLVVDLVIRWKAVLRRRRSGDPGRRIPWGRTFSQPAAAFISGLISAAVLYLVLEGIRSGVSAHEFLAPLLATFGPPLVILAILIGASIEVGLIGGYEEEDMREWRASLGAYFLMIAAVWTIFIGLSIYGPLLIWATSQAATAAIAAGWLTISTLGVLAGRSSRTGDSNKGGPINLVAMAAPVIFLVGLLAAVAMLASLLQRIPIPTINENPGAPAEFLKSLIQADPVWTFMALALCSVLAAYNCYKINVNLFSMHLFYANRLVRCYLGASRPREAPAEGRPNFAPTNCPVPARRPNPLTGFDPDDDFPIKELAVVRRWDRDDGDLVCDYRGPYQLINTAMNLVSGSDLAWQDRMAESFVLSPLFCGSQSTGYRKVVVTETEIREDPVYGIADGKSPDGLVKGYGGDLRLGTAISVSGAAASPNMGYHSSPLVTILMTVFNARLGLWLPNPAKETWRESGPGFASYLIDELTGRTTNKGSYVYLSDGGHFENLGVYELVRRRCRYIILCDAGADPNLSFWDLGSLVRKCREDFGVRIEIDIAPLLKRAGTDKSKWHCAVGSIHYDEIDSSHDGSSGKEPLPGVLLYVKPSITGDEPSDVRNYVVDHPDFPQQPTSDQFFDESQFESYRVLGEHTATEVFSDAVRRPGGVPKAEDLFKRLRQRWLPPVDLEEVAPAWEATSGNGSSHPSLSRSSS